MRLPIIIITTTLTMMMMMMTTMMMIMIQKREKRRKMTPETDVEKPRQTTADAAHVGSGQWKGSQKPQAEQEENRE